MTQLDLFCNETSNQVAIAIDQVAIAIEDVIVSITEGASDEKRMAVSWLQSFKEKLESGQLQLN